VIHPILGAGPTPELLAIVCQYRQLVTRGLEGLEILGRLFGRPERDEIAQPFVDGEERDPLAVGFGPVGHVEPLLGKAAHEEMAVVDQGVFHTGLREVGGELGLPDPLGQPEPGRFDPEAAPESLLHPADLIQAIPARQRGEHGLVEPGQQELHPPVRGEAPESVHPRRCVHVEPLEQRTGNVEDDREEISRGQAVEQRGVHVVQVLLKNVVEVPHRLVQVQAENEAHGGHAVSSGPASGSR
jgi:hypothetical protein